MNRIQKKCFIASAGFHLLLAVVLLVGPALSSKDKALDLPLLEFVPVITTDELVSGGGNRNAVLPAPAPLPQPPAPQPVVAPPAPQPQPPQPAVKETKTASDVPDKVSESKPRKNNVNTTLISRRNTSRTIPTVSDSDSQSRADAERRRLLANASRNIRQGLSSSTSIDMPGPGTGGLPYANFLQAVQTVYARAWQGRVPDGATDKDMDATASVTIGRDGTVISASIVRPSGNAVVDRAVREVLDSVGYAAPLPEGSKENQRTVTIKFKVNTGQLAG